MKNMKTIILLSGWPGFKVLNVPERLTAITIPGAPTQAFWAEEDTLVVEVDDLPSPGNATAPPPPGAATFRHCRLLWDFVEIWTRDGEIQPGRDIRAEVAKGLRDADQEARLTLARATP